MELTTASARARRIRGLCHQLEERHEGTRWTTKDDMLGLVNDVGNSAGSRWPPMDGIESRLEARIARADS